jgi:hypothetical protein
LMIIYMLLTTIIIIIPNQISSHIIIHH